MTDPKTKTEPARIDLQAAKAALEARPDLQQGGFFVLRPDDGPRLPGGADAALPSPHGEIFRSQLSAALKEGEAGEPARSQSVYASSLEPPAPKEALSPHPPTVTPIRVVEEAAPRKKKMTVRRFLLGF